MLGSVRRILVRLLPTVGDSRVTLPTVGDSGAAVTDGLNFRPSVSGRWRNKASKAIRSHPSKSIRSHCL